MDALCEIAVDLFVLISGYFSCTTTKKSILKPIKLVIQVIFFSEFYYFVQIVFGHTNFSIKHFCALLLPNNYFVIIYSAVYLVSPFINFLLQKLSYKDLRIFLIISFLLFSCEPTLVDFIEFLIGQKLAGMHTISAFGGSGSGYTFVNFLLMYMIGAFLRLRPNESKFKFEKRKIFLGILIIANTILMTILTLSNINGLVSYCSPLVIINAVLVFELFSAIDIKQSKIINRFAAGSFTVFLTHMWFMRYFNVEDAVSKSLPLLFFHLIFVVIICYFLGWICFEIYSFCSEPVYKFLAKKINFYIVDVSDK